MGSSSGGLVVRPDRAFDGVKVFSATMAAQRGELGDRINAWIASNANVAITEFVVTQSSDSDYHCIAITLFYQSR
jgi:hypothetical protein